MTKCAGDAMNPDIEGVVPSAKSSPDINNVPMYLGDGVYMTHNDFQVRIYTSDGERETNVIYLDKYSASDVAYQLEKWLEGK